MPSLLNLFLHFSSIFTSSSSSSSPFNLHLVLLFFLSFYLLSSDPSRSDLQDASVSPMRLIGAIVLPVLQALSTISLEMIMAEQVRVTQVRVITSLSEIISLCVTV